METVDLVTESEPRWANRLDPEVGELRQSRKPAIAGCTAAKTKAAVGKVLGLKFELGLETSEVERVLLAAGVGWFKPETVERHKSKVLATINRKYQEMVDALNEASRTTHNCNVDLDRCVGLSAVWGIFTMVTYWYLYHSHWNQMIANSEIDVVTAGALLWGAGFGFFWVTKLDR